MKVKAAAATVLVLGLGMGCAAQEWTPLWTGYTAHFMDDQIRVIDHDAGDRSTSEAQAYAMFFSLVANDRSRFDRLVRWTELNLAAGDLGSHLPAWLWGRTPDNHWGVLDANSASDADVWMAYTLLEAGRAWNEPHYRELGENLARQIAAMEVTDMPGFGPVLMPGAAGFHHDRSYRLNASYLPLQVFVRLAHLFPEGPWRQIAEHIPQLVVHTAPRGFATDWVDFEPDAGFTPSALGSYDAIRVYLWAGMLHPETPGRTEVLGALPAMASYLHAHPDPPARVKADGTVENAKGPVGFSAALLPYLAAVGQKDLYRAQMTRVRSELNPSTGLYGNPSKYYDQNLALFGLGAEERQFWFDAEGGLLLRWNSGWWHLHR